MAIDDRLFERKPSKWIKDFWHLAKPYWRSEEQMKSIGLVIFIVAFNLLVVYMTVLFNKWNNVFYNAIAHLDKVGFIHAIYKFSIMAFFYILFQICAYYFRKILEIRWRKWLTRYYLDSWLNTQSYYKTRFVEQITDNPDQRISEDINSFIGLSLDLTLGLINSLVSLGSFSFILWQISGAWHFNLWQHHFVINGYMFWAALIYAIAGTFITFKIGRPLIRLNYQQQAYEAEFRFGLMRVREHAESIALFKGEPQEIDGLSTKFTNVVHNFINIMFRQIKIDIFSVAYGQAAVIFPIVVAAPRYFAKLIQLGDLMQIASAFGRVQDALSYFINSYSSLSGFRAVMNRLYGFEMAISEARLLKVLPRIDSDNYLSVDNLTINLPNGKQLINGLTFSANTRERILITGYSGSGKTTLLRTIAHLWPYASGSIAKKPGIKELFVAQKPYLPISTLKEAICYPKLQQEISDETVGDYLDKCQLGFLRNDLHISCDWSQKLSMGQQQLLAFCRIFVNLPDIVYLDEATSALDEEKEDLVYGLLIDILSTSVIISVGHRNSIRKWHSQVINITTPPDENC